MRPRRFSRPLAFRGRRAAHCRRPARSAADSAAIRETLAGLDLAAEGVNESEARRWINTILAGNIDDREALDRLETALGLKGARRAA